MKKANNGKWSNANPRSSGNDEAFRKAVPAAVMAKFERLEATHKNSMENAPFFIGAVLAGNFAGLSSGAEFLLYVMLCWFANLGATDTLNTATGAFLALRVLYIFSYANISTNKMSFIRSAIWIASVSVLFRLYWLAGNALAARG